MVYWAGVYHLSTNDSSEELGSLTYGTTLGEAAQTGNSSLGLGVNYTSSSNVDKFGIQANASFMYKALTIRRCMPSFQGCT